MSYVTISEADTYFETRMFSEGWDRALTTQRNKALGHATKILDALSYLGAKTISTQDNEFPRDITSDVVPQDVKDATCEIALALLDGVDPEREREGVSLESQGYSSVRSTYNREFVQAHISAGIPSATAWSLITKYLKHPGKLRISRV